MRSHLLREINAPLIVAIANRSDTDLHNMLPSPRGCAGGRIGTRFLRPRGTSPLKGVNPAGTPGYRNGTESFFGLKGRLSVVQDV
jgi:hypothetical protein